MPLISWQSCFIVSGLLSRHAAAFTGSKYELTYEYSGTNFFDGWDFYSGRDPTGGFVTYYSRSSAQLTGLISSSDNGPAYMGVNYMDTLPFNNQTGQGDGAGRPSVRIASKQAFTHGLFIGDFGHIPAGICGTWPAFWTLGPNWPYTGEIDILEGVNQNTNNIMSLHTNETCFTYGNSSVMTGTMGNQNCAYYPDYNVGCGVIDSSPKSFGTGFNQGGGGVYAMQWTSEYIRIWQWSRATVPSDVDNAQPDPSSWGLPSAQLAVGNCSVDNHFQSHKIIFDTTFCGEYAGNPYVWKTDDSKSCAGSTGLATCDNFVANNPAAFKDAYWSVNYVRVFDLLDPSSDATPIKYIASEQPTNAATNAYTAPATVATPNIDVDQLCPKYNFSIITDGKYQYEIACDFDPPGPDIIGDPYPGFQAKSLADCIKGCTYMNENNGTNKCGGVSHFAEINFCYFKKYIDGNLRYRPGYNEIRLIYYGYPQITDDPRFAADSTLTSSFVETIPTPQSYRPSTITNTTITSSTAMTSTPSTTNTLTTSIALPPLGDNSTSSSTSVPSNYSETATNGYTDATRTVTPMSSTMASTDPTVTNSDFYITFDVGASTRRLRKRDTQYLAFDGAGQSILVTDQSVAAKFRLDSNNLLMTGTQYVAVDSDVTPPRFLLSDSEPETPAKVEVGDNGTVQVQGVNGYCFTSDGELAVSTDSKDLPDDCPVIQPQLEATNDDSTTTSSEDSSQISTESSTETSSPMISMEGPSATTTASSTKSSFSSSVTETSSTSVQFSEGDTSSTSSSSIESRTTSSSKTTTSSKRSMSMISSSSSTSSTSTAVILNSFIYAGCFGITSANAKIAGPQGATVPYTDSAMTNDKCTKHCGEQNSYYAGTHGIYCFCGPNEDLYADLITYPDASCNEPCPGANREVCGGEVGYQSAVPATMTEGSSKRNVLEKRQAVLFLVSLYNNTLLLGGLGEGDVPTTTDSNRKTTSHTMTQSPMNMNDPFATASISYNVTGTNTATVISTTYVDVCHVCPGGLTTKAITITIPHCGCTASFDRQAGSSVSVPSPTVPMVTTTKSCHCGEGGAQSTVTITIPHTDSIAQLTAPVPVGSSGNADADGQPGDAVAKQQPAGVIVGLNAASSLPEDTGTSGTTDEGTADNISGSETISDINEWMPEDDEDWDFPETNDIPTTAVIGQANTGGQSAPAYEGASNADLVNAAAAAPASSLKPAVASNTAVPAGWVSNYTVPAMAGANSSSTPPGPVALYTSGGSTLLRHSVKRVTTSMECRFMLSLIVGVVFGVLVGVW